MPPGKGLIHIAHNDFAKTGTCVEFDTAYGGGVWLPAERDACKAGMAVGMHHILPWHLQDEFTEGTVCIDMAVVANLLAFGDVYHQLTKGTAGFSVAQTGQLYIVGLFSKRKTAIKALVVSGELTLGFLVALVTFQLYTVSGDMDFWLVRLAQSV